MPRRLCCAEESGRRARGYHPPWGASCWVAGVVGFALVAGHYALAAYCLPQAATISVSVVHAVGIALYAWLLACDVADRVEATAPADHHRP